jgi:[histone H3]-lysine36 N-dimethyltransferase SETMAR
MIYCAQLAQIQLALSQLRTAIANQSQILLIFDNKKQHTAKMAKKKTTTCVRKLPFHPYYSPDLALSEYRLFMLLGHFLC